MTFPPFTCHKQTGCEMLEHQIRNDNSLTANNRFSGEDKVGSQRPVLGGKTFTACVTTNIPSGCKTKSRVIVPTTGTTRTSVWYAHYQCLVHGVPTFGSTSNSHTLSSKLSPLRLHLALSCEAFHGRAVVCQTDTETSGLSVIRPFRFPFPVKPKSVIRPPTLHYSPKMMLTD